MKSGRLCMWPPKTWPSFKVISTVKMGKPPQSGMQICQSRRLSKCDTVSLTCTAVSLYHSSTDCIPPLGYAFLHLRYNIPLPHNVSAVSLAYYEQAVTRQERSLFTPNCESEHDTDSEDVFGIVSQSSVDGSQSGVGQATLQPTAGKPTDLSSAVTSMPAPPKGKLTGQKLPSSKTRQRNMEPSCQSSPGAGNSQPGTPALPSKPVPPKRKLADLVSSPKPQEHSEIGGDPLQDVSSEEDWIFERYSEQATVSEPEGTENETQTSRMQLTAVEYHIITHLD
ncbi:uncharacterized protein LOC135383178 [Ornithodoros turicata]|uniref:uncharacterized protein LOC135383178 n=1 Tax=Ornithodoros turicata TaxID=34597 RepID=UPI0031397846